VNTGKQIYIMVILIFLLLAALGGYVIWEPFRSEEAEKEQEVTTAERGALLFSLNCRICHGDRGEGGGIGGRLALAPPLDRPDLQGRAGPDEPVDAAAAKDAFNLITNTITCGRVGTAMPTWGEKEGGPLNDTQIEQLATLINRGDEWDAAAEFAREADATGVTLTQGVSAEDTTLQVSDASTFAADGVILADEERMTIQEVHDSALMVERAARGSEAAPHTEGAEIFNQPVPPDPPAIVQQACGQFARFAPPPTTPTVGPTEVPGTPGAPTPAQEATATAAAPSGEAQVVEISAVPSLKFDKSELRVKAGGKVTVRFTNDDAGVPHNWALYTDDSASEAIVGANEDICTGPCEVEITFDAPPPGEYFFRCDVHPSIMTGTFIVEE